MALKIKINNNNDFETAQKFIFENNGVWFSGDQNIVTISNIKKENFDVFGVKVDYDDIDYSGNKVIYLTYFESEYDFNEDLGKEITLNELLVIENLTENLAN